MAHNVTWFVPSQRPRRPVYGPCAPSSGLPCQALELWMPSGQVALLTPVFSKDLASGSHALPTTSCLFSLDHHVGGNAVRIFGYDEVARETQQQSRSTMTAGKVCSGVVEPIEGHHP